MNTKKNPVVTQRYRPPNAADTRARIKLHQEFPDMTAPVYLDPTDDGVIP